MSDINFAEMKSMQRELWEKHRNKWSPLEPYYARNSLLWMMEELGEVIAIIKKREEDAIANDPEVHRYFVEELVDVQMYFNDVLMRYGITPEEFGDAYRAKHNRNMGRDFQQEHGSYV